MSQHKIPVETLSNGQSIPIIGFGTFKATNNETLTAAIKYAIDIGYRHFDCAWVYQNEVFVGKALKEAMEQSNVKREDLYLVSKIWNTHHSKGLVRKCLEDTLTNLDTDYLDLLLCHWPMGYAENTGKEPFPFDESGKIRFSDVDYIESYQAMEELCVEGKTKSIGLSNFNIQQIENVLKIATIKPVMCQMEINIFNQNRNLVQYCFDNKISVAAYAPLGANDRAWAKPDDPKILENPIILNLANKYNRTPAQICLKWVLQRGIIVIVKSVTPSRIKENIQLFDFTLSDEDMDEIKEIKDVFRYYSLPLAKEHKFYPFI